MVLLLILVVLLGTAALGATVHAVLTDGYGPRPSRCDRFAATRPL